MSDTLPKNAKYIRADLVLPGDFLDLRNNIFVDPQGLRELSVYYECKQWRLGSNHMVYLKFHGLGEYCFPPSAKIVWYGHV